MPIFATFQEDPLVLPVGQSRVGAGKSWLGVPKLANPRPPPKQMKGTEVLQWHIQHHEVSKPFGRSMSSPCPLLPVPPSTAVRPVILICSGPPLTVSNQAGGQGCSGFVLCHQQGKRDSSVLKTEVCRACFVARERAGALSRGSDGTESLRSVAAGAQGSAAQRLDSEGGRIT